MKKLLILIVFIGFWSAETQAQMKKDSWMLEWSAGLERSRSYFPDADQKSTLSGYSLHPKAGYFVSDNFVLGFSGILGSTRWRNKDYDPDISNDFKKTKFVSYGGGIFLRKFVPINESLAFFAEISSEVFWVSRKSVFNAPMGTSKEIEGRAFSAQGALGLQYLISPKLGVHMQTNLIQYESDKTPPSSDISQSEFQAGFLLNPRFGFTLFL